VRRGKRGCCSENRMISSEQFPPQIHRDFIFSTTSDSRTLLHRSSRENKNIELDTRSVNDTKIPKSSSTTSGRSGIGITLISTFIWIVEPKKSSTTIKQEFRKTRTTLQVKKQNHDSLQRMCISLWSTISRSRHFFCWILDLFTPSFSITIEGNRTVDDLKNAIWKEKKHTRACFECRCRQSAIIHFH
jgi:hypothetical protein